MRYDSDIHPTALLEQPYRRYMGGKEPTDIEYRVSRFDEGIQIGPGAIIGKGVVLERGVVIDHYCAVEPNATIGAGSLLIYRCTVGGESVIGAECVIGGFVAEGCVVGPRCRIFGQLIHKQLDTLEPWDEHEVPEPSARVEADSFIGFGALIIGGVTVGPRAYVCAGAIVTRDVPAHFIASGVNTLTPIEKWRGQLATNPALRSADSA